MQEQRREWLAAGRFRPRARRGGWGLNGRLEWSLAAGPQEAKWPEAG